MDFFSWLLPLDVGLSGINDRKSLLIWSYSYADGCKPLVDCAVGSLNKLFSTDEIVMAYLVHCCTHLSAGMS